MIRPSKLGASTVAARLGGNGGESAGESDRDMGPGVPHTVQTPAGAGAQRVGRPEEGWGEAGGPQAEAAYNLRLSMARVASSNTGT